MLTPSSLIKHECEILLDRILHAQSLTFFGEDGGGQFGRSEFPITASVRHFDFELDIENDEPEDPKGIVQIYLDGYRASQFGHAVTDANLRINLDILLDREHVDRDALTWADIGMQGENFITLYVDVAKLLSW